MGFSSVMLLDRPSYRRQLSEEEVGDQARQLLLGFIQGRLRNDGYGDSVQPDMMHRPSVLHAYALF